VALPNIPAAVAVSVDPKTTAFLVLDLNSAICQPDPNCMAIVPGVATLLKKMRDAKVPVVYSRGGAEATVVPALAPQADEPTISARADKFLGSDLDNVLKKAGATTLIVTGWSANGAVMYSSFHANALGYTVVVPEDLLGGDIPFQTVLARWQLLNEPGFSNADNKPLADKLVTLSRTDLISIK